jgi:FKBP-type peptidyl-prolyl cis-trans isomerase
MTRRSLMPIVLLALCSLAPLGCSDAPPGVKVEDLVEGEGPACKTGDLVEVHYTGRLTDGKVFDSSAGRRPFRFRIGVGEVIPGWDEGVPGMKVGGKRKLIIPPNLAYGSSTNSKIPANSTLVFEIELVKIVPKGGGGKDESESGLKIEDLKEGTGEAAKTGDLLEVHYTGWLANGTKFDSSLDHNKPITFKLGVDELIEGWHKGLIGMKVGGKRKLTIPPELGYGDRKDQPNIPPGSTLIFEVELLRILK